MTETQTQVQAQTAPHLLRPRHASRSVRAAYQQLTLAQKPGHGVPAYLRWVNRPMGRGAAAVAYRLNLTPNMVSGISVLFSCAAMVILILGRATPFSAAVAAVLLLIGYALDSADGQLARLANLSSARGEWLDHLVDAFRLPAVHIAIAVALLHTEQQPLVWPVLVAAGFALLTSVWFFGQILAEKLQRNSQTRPGSAAPAWVSVLKLYTDVGFLYLLVIALAWPAVFIPAYTALAVLTGTTAALSLLRKYRSL